MSHVCPRRRETHLRLPGDTGQDTYEVDHGLIGQPRGCSYCGSMPPDDFMDHVRAGRPIGPTDKSYKIYVHEIPRDGDPDDLRVVGHSTHPSDAYKPWSQLSRAEKRAARAYDNGFSKRSGRSIKDGGWMFSTWGDTVEGKFYTSHLSPDQGHEFWRLHQAGQVNWSYPLYRPLYLPGPSDERATDA